MVLRIYLSFMEVPMPASLVTVENSLVEIISAPRQSAWNRAARRTYKESNVEEIIKSEGLDYPVWKEQLNRPNGMYSGYEAVVANYKGRDFVYGATKDYTVVHINSIMRSLSEVPYNVESAVALNNGQFIAVNYNYGKYTIVGEEYNIGLTILHPYKPGFAWRAMLTPVRLHCMNALVTAKRESVSDLRVWHRSPAEAKIDIAMLQTNAEQMKLAMQSSMEKLAHTMIIGKEGKLIQKVYKDTAVGVVVANLYRQFEREQPEFRGTAYALYQAVVEAEDYRPPRKNQSDRIIAESALVGTRAMKKTQMYDALINLN